MDGKICHTSNDCGCCAVEEAKHDRWHGVSGNGICINEQLIYKTICGA